MDQDAAIRPASTNAGFVAAWRMLSEHRDDYSGIFRALALVDGRGIGRHQHVEFPKSVCDGATVEARNDLTGIGVDVVDIADIAVVDLFVVIVLDLHDLVAGGKGPAEALDLAIAGGSPESEG